MKMTYIHEREKFFCDLSNEDLSEQNEFADRVGEDGGGDLQKLRKLLKELTVQRLERRTTLLNVVCQLEKQPKLFKLLSQLSNKTFKTL